MTTRISSLEYNKLALWTKDKMADVPKESESYEMMEDLARRLEQKAKEAKENEKRLAASGETGKEKKQWKCKSCDTITTIRMVKKCERCGALDNVQVVAPT